MALQHLRSSTANKRPTPAGMSDGQLALNTNNTSPGLFFKDSNGALVKVGPVHVGTTAPNATPGAGGSSGNAVGEQWLDTSGANPVLKIWNGSAWQAASGGASVTTSDTAPSSPSDGDLWYDSVGGRLYVYYQDPNGSQWVDASPQASGTSITTGNTSAQVIDTGSDGRFVVTTEGTERLRVDSSGRVGIGTTAPPEKLTIASGNIYLDAAAPKLYLGTDGFNYIEGSANPTNILKFFTNNTERGRFDASGRFLVGTSSASTAGTSKLLQVVDAGGGAIGLGRTSASSIASGEFLGGIDFLGAGLTPSAHVWCYADAAQGSTTDLPSRLVFSTTADGASAPTERMRITSNGLVAFEQDYSGKYAQRINSSSTSSTQFFIQFARGGAECGYILSGGANSTTYSTSSDYRLKENLVPLPNAIDRTKQLKVYRFNFIEEPERTIDGFVAHEVQTIVPEAIVGEKDEVYEDGRIKPQGIDQSKLVPLLTAALQEAVAKIESLEARLTAAGL